MKHQKSCPSKATQKKQSANLADCFFCVERQAPDIGAATKLNGVNEK